MTTTKRELTLRELVKQHQEVDTFMADKGLGYTAAEGYEAHQVFAAVNTTGAQSAVIARVRTDDGKTYFCYGFYFPDAALQVAQRVKRIRRYWVMDVIIVDSVRNV